MSEPYSAFNPISQHHYFGWAPVLIFGSKGCAGQRWWHALRAHFVKITGHWTVSVPCSAVNLISQHHYFGSDLWFQRMCRPKVVSCTESALCQDSSTLNVPCSALQHKSTNKSFKQFKSQACKNLPCISFKEMKDYQTIHVSQIPQMPLAPDQWTFARNKGWSQVVG